MISKPTHSWKNHDVVLVVMASHGESSHAAPSPSSFHKQPLDDKKIFGEFGLFLDVSSSRSQVNRAPAEKTSTRSPVPRPFRKFQKHVSFARAGLLESYQQDASSTTQQYDVPAIELWHTPEDFKRFHFQAKLEAQVVHADSTKFLVESLEDCHSMILQLANTLKQCGDRDKEAMLWNQVHQRIHTNLESGLAQWCFTPYRGLELHTSVQLRRHKFSTRRKMGRDLDRQESFALLSVSRQQQQLRSLSAQEKRKSLSPEELASHLERRSQASRLFARMIGQADELAVKYSTYE